MSKTGNGIKRQTPFCTFLTFGGGDEEDDEKSRFKLGFVTDSHKEWGERDQRQGTVKGQGILREDTSTSEEEGRLAESPWAGPQELAKFQSWEGGQQQRQFGTIYRKRFLMGSASLTVAFPAAVAGC